MVTTIGALNIVYHCSKFQIRYGCHLVNIDLKCEGGAELYNIFKNKKVTFVGVYDEIMMVSGL